MTRRPAPRNPVVFRKVAPPAGRHCAELRAGAPCGGFIRDGLDECPVCAFDRAFEREFIGYPEDE